MFPTNGTSYLTIGTESPKEKSHVIIVKENANLHISCILMTRPRSIRTRRSAHILGAVVDVVVDAAMDAVTDKNVSARSGSMIIRMEIKMIMEMVFKIGVMLGCTIAAIKSVDEILPTLLYFMLLGSVILAPLPLQLTMPVRSCQGILMVLQLALEPLR